MREIQLEGKVYAHTKYAISAIAWATNRRGHNEWESDDVVATIYDYLIRNNVKMETTDYRGRDKVLVGVAHVERAIIRLVEAKLAHATWSSHPRHRRLIKFGFEPDVTLTGHSVDKLPVSEPVVAEHRLSGVAEPVKLDIQLPMPEIPYKPYRHEEVTDLLQRWQKADAEAHANYIDTLIETLKVVLDG